MICLLSILNMHSAYGHQTNQVCPNEYPQLTCPENQVMAPAINFPESSSSTCMLDPCKLPENPFYINAKQVRHLWKDVFHLENENDFLVQLIRVAQNYAQVPISNYYVGAAALGASGDIYLGANLEFSQVALNQSVHAEQFVITNAQSHKEKQIVKLAVSAAPCGHCRQFLRETSQSLGIQIFISNQTPKTLEHLLPESFGPEDLGQQGGLLSSQNHQLKLCHLRTHQSTLTPCHELTYPSLAYLALEAAKESWAPYTSNASGIAIKTKDNRIFKGSYAENAAFNPSLSPLQAALVNVVASGQTYQDIMEVILVEKQSALTNKKEASQAAETINLLKHLAPHVNLQIYDAIDK